MGGWCGRDNSTADNNTAIGYSCFEGNTTGYNNVAIGQSAARWFNGGFYNIFIGYMSGSTTGNVGSRNTCLGTFTGDALTTGTYNTFLGYNADVNTGSFTNATAIGNAAIATASNQVRIGNTAVTSIGGYAAWTNLSDGRFKINVKEEVIGLDFILKLRPVTYNINTNTLNTFLKNEEQAENDNALHTGFIAQEVEQAANQVGYNFSGVDKPKNENDMYGLRYAEFVVPIVKALQELNEKLNSEIESQKSEIDALRADIEKLRIK
ncbi:MAG: tail fiber domain-containing protein [Bacteroidetes bacterium]|nr:tail fiber domain-containing protein [Bacteroidota bacterium]